MDYAALLCVWETTVHHSIRLLLKKSNYYIHTRWYDWYTQVGYHANNWSSFSCLTSIPLKPRVQLCIFLTLNTLLTVKNNKRIKENRSPHNTESLKVVEFYCCDISQTPKHIQDMFNFNTISNPCGYLVLFVSKTPSVVWYFIMDLIPPKFHSYFALFESKYVVIFICIHCLIISFKLHKFTQNLCRVFSSPNPNSYIVFH